MNVYEMRGQKGPAGDFEEIFQAGSQMASKLNEFPEARQLFDEVSEVIDQTQFPIEGGNLEEVVRAIRMAAKDQSWESYEGVQFDTIRAELERAGVPLLRKKISGDLAA